MNIQELSNHNNLEHIDSDESKSAESYQLYKQMVEKSVDVIYRLNIKTGKFDYISPSSIEFLGYTPEEMCSLSAVDTLKLVHPNDVMKIKQSTMDIKRGKIGPKGFQRIEYRLKHKDNSYRWFCDVRRPGPGNNGNVKYIEGSGRDITSRKLFQEYLIESEEKYSTVVEQSADGILIVQEGRFVFVNKAMSQISGYSQEELITMPISNIVPSDKKDFITQRYKDRILGKKVPSRYEVGILRKDGEIIDAELSAAVIKYGGKPADLVTLRDISDRLKAEVALRESKDRYETLVESFGIGIALVNSDLEITTVNRQMREWFPNIHESGNSPCYSVFNCSPSDNICRKCPICKTFKTGMGQEKTFDIALENKTSSFRIVSKPLKNDKGKVHDIIIMVDDISERKKAEDSLKQAYEFQKQILSTAATAIFTVDKDKHITSVNDEFCASTGYSREEILGESCHILQGIPCVEICGLFDGEHDGKITKKQCSFRSKDGKQIFVYKNATLVKDEKGQVTGGIESFMDVTELIQAKEEAIAADKAKSEFLANMSHEIRTPLNGIIGMTQLALELDLDSELREYLELSKASADSLLFLLNDILDFSKIEAGKLDIDHISFSLRDCLGKTMGSMALRAHKKKLELAYHIPPEVPDSLIGDPGRIRQIIINLVGNAIKFTMGGEVVANIKKISETDDEVTLHITVEDTGIGIPQKMLSSIFDPFIQADGSTKRKFGGTGLGLAISSRLVEMMGGHIWAESDEGMGTRFHFTIKCGIQKNPVTRIKRIDINRLKGMPVLIVDDNSTNRRILAEIVSNWKMKPTLAKDGYEGLEIFNGTINHGGSFPLILLDGQMPQMDGFQFAERLKQHKESSKSAIIMLTSAGQRGDAKKCRELGIDAYLMKPVQHFDLLEAISKSLSLKDMEKTDNSLITRHTIAEDRKKVKILLVEDNPVNRKFATSLLTKRGYSVMEAVTGLDAVYTFEDHDFDMILMDVQMPEMDGLEATIEIRKREEDTGTHIPIIAMTAHAMKGDKERCLKAGMDGYISKPVQVSELMSCIKDIVTNKMQKPAVEKKRLVGNSLIDTEDLMARIDGDMELLCELVELFNEDSENLINELHKSITNNDIQRIERYAHTIKSSVGNFSKGKAFEEARKLEFMARENKLENVMEAFTTLKKEIDKVKTALSIMAKEVA